MGCVACGSAAVTERPDRTARGYRRFRCRACRKGFNERSGGRLNRTQYPSDVIALVVLWRLRYRLILRDLAEMFLVRGFVFSSEAVREWCWFPLNRSCLTLGDGSWLQRQHAGAEEFASGAAVHGTFQRLQAADLPLGHAVAPRLGHRIPHRVEVAPQRADEALHGVDAAIMCVLQPALQPAGVSATQDASEAHGQLPHGREPRHLGLQGVNRGHLAFGQLAAWLDAKGCRDLR